MIECPNCKTKLEKGDAFCTNCGTKIEAPKKTTKKSAKPKVFCTNCGNAMEADDKFCTNCGFNPNQVVEPTPKVAPTPVVENTPVAPSNSTQSSGFDAQSFISRNITALPLLIIGALLIIVGIIIVIPDRSFSFYFIEEYVGGDAYNAMIEASLRGGEIAGAMISKAVCICSGIITAAIGFVNLKLK